MGNQMAKEHILKQMVLFTKALGLTISPTGRASKCKQMEQDMKVNILTETNTGKVNITVVTIVSMKENSAIIK